MTRHLFALSLLGLSFALNPSFAAAQETLRPLAEALLDVQADAGALETRIETERFAALKSLPENTPIRMTGLNAKWRLPFVIARDELATKASVTFKWTPSPVLLPVKSQLNLRLNGELERSLPITTEEIGRTVVTTVELNPKRLKDLNELEFEFVGSYEHNCESPADASLWLEIDRESTLTLSKQKIRVANELQLLPSPFLDPGARSRITLPVLFPARPSDKALQAAAVLASWAGKTADWRDLSLPVHYGEAPAEGHFVVFATPETLPEFLRGTAEITGPEVRIADAPHSDWAKVLVIAGRNDEELVEAAQALALEGDRFAGPRVLVTESPRLPPRPAYDARKWLPTDRKVRFDELVDHPSQLRSRGTFPDPIAVHFRLAPDLFVLPRTSIPMELSYRYTPPGDDAAASVRVRINDALMGYEVLESDESATAPVVRRVAALDAMAGFLRALSLPTVHLDAANTLAEGEVKQMVNAHDPTVDEKRYFEVIERKTACLFEAGAKMAAAIADCSEKDEAAVREYALALGNAFQIVDDMLDYTGVSSDIGKNLGADLREGKVTLPLLYARLHTSEENRALIDAAIRSGNGDFDKISSIVIESQAIARCKQRAEQELERGKAALLQLSPSIFRDSLIQLLLYTVCRDR